jgi:hypothetical protein
MSIVVGWAGGGEGGVWFCGFGVWFSCGLGVWFCGGVVPGPGVGPCEGGCCCAQPIRRIALTNIIKNSVSIFIMSPLMLMWHSLFISIAEL